MVGCIRSKQSGFTLMEVLTSIVVLTVVASGVIGSQIYVKRSSANLQQKMLAFQAIDKRFAAIKIDDARSLSTNLNWTWDGKVPELKNGVMFRKVTLAPTGTTPATDPNLRRVDLAVLYDLPWAATKSWDCPAGAPKSACVRNREESATAVFYGGY